MLLEPGTKLLVAHRRLFDTDQSRFFVGSLDAYEDGVALITGFSWNRDPYSGVLAMKQGLRTKVVSIASGMVLAYILPNELELSALRIETDEHQSVFLTDGAAFKMDLTERKLRV